MRVLLVTAAKEEEVLLARKHLGYDKLIVLTPQGKGKELTLSSPMAQVEEVPQDDLLACLERMEALLQQHKGRVRCAVDGGTSAMSAGAFLACLSQGVEAWFLRNKAVRLPVLHARPVERRFSEEELAVLRAVEERASYDELAKRTGLPMELLKDTCLALRKLGAVQTDANGARLSGLGAYYQKGLR